MSLEGYEPHVEPREQHLGLWASVLKRLGGENRKNIQASAVGMQTPRGVYMHGGVGTGKTFMMDLFYKVSVFSASRHVPVVVDISHATVLTAYPNGATTGRRSIWRRSLRWDDSGTPCHKTRTATDNTATSVTSLLVALTGPICLLKKLGTPHCGRSVQFDLKVQMGHTRGCGSL